MYDREFGWRASTVGKRKNCGGTDKPTYPSKTVGGDISLGKRTERSGKSFHQKTDASRT